MVLYEILCPRPTTRELSANSQANHKPYILGGKVEFSKSAVSDFVTDPKLNRVDEDAASDFVIYPGKVELSCMMRAR